MNMNTCVTLARFIRKKERSSSGGGRVESGQRVRESTAHVTLTTQVSCNNIIKVKLHGKVRR